MSRENVEKLLSGYDAFARGDIGFIVDNLVDEDVSWHPAIAPLLGVGAMRGKERLRRFFAVDIAEGFTEFTATPVAVEDLGESVLVQTHYEGYGRASGAPVTLDSFSLFTFRDGKIISYFDFDSRAEALDGAGLSE